MGQQRGLRLQKQHGAGVNENGTAPLLLSVDQAAKLLGISRNLCYEQISEGTIPHVRLGRRVLVSRVALEQWIARQSLGDIESGMVSSRLRD